MGSWTTSEEECLYYFKSFDVSPPPPSSPPPGNGQIHFNIGTQFIIQKGNKYLIIETNFGNVPAVSLSLSPAQFNALKAFEFGVLT